MQNARIALFAALMIGPAFTLRVHAADNPLGFYIGAALGESDVRVSDSALAGSSGFAAHRDGWKLLVGLRPIPLLGAELDYMDFGHARFVEATGSSTDLSGDSHPKATTVFGVIYAPIPLPLLDVYAKAGVARLQTSVNADTFCTVSPCNVAVVAPFALHRTSSSLAYGAGVQFKFAAFAARLEYERINVSTGDPDLTSLGITWSF